MDSLMTVVDTTHAVVVAVSETLRTTVSVVDTSRTVVAVGGGQGVPETWTALAAITLAWCAQTVRGFSRIPNFVSDVLIFSFGIMLYMVGFDGQIQLSRGYFMGAIMWLASVRGVGSWLANAGLALKSNSK